MTAATVEAMADKTKAFLDAHPNLPSAMQMEFVLAETGLRNAALMLQHYEKGASA